MNKKINKLKVFVGDCLYEFPLREINQLVLSKKKVGYRDLIEQVYDLHFANFGSYSRHFNSDSWDVTEVLVNSIAVQNLWRKEQGLLSASAINWRISYQFIKRPFLSELIHLISPMHRTLIQQVKLTQPDVVILTDIHLYPSSVLKKLKSHTNLLVGHISSEIHAGTPIKLYDLILTSIDEHCRDFQRQGIRSLKFLPAFDTANTPECIVSRDIDCVFVGSMYSGTASLLAEVKKQVPEIQIYSPNLTTEMRHLGLEENYQGPVFGREMFKILARAKLVINRHGNPLSKYGNVRTFEVTGMGSALLTEKCDGLATIFKPDSEVFTYDDIDNIGLKARVILDFYENTLIVSSAGQQRTLETHTYKQRYSDLEATLINLLSKTNLSK